MNKIALIGNTQEQLRQIAVEMGMPAFTGSQIAQWIYQKRVTSIDEMNNISIANRERLSSKYCVGYSTPSHEQRSVDGTVKYLFAVPGSNRGIESVYIPDKERATLCVSSQVGCKMNCYFCMTGKGGFDGNLTAGDIINQIMMIPESEKLTNVVFMGMGEPLDNIGALLPAIEIMTAKWGLAWSPKRITVSSIGKTDNLRTLLATTSVHIAISIHSPYPKERAGIMPVEKAYPIESVLSLLKEYDFSHQRRLSFEYIMFNGFNDDIRHSNALAHLLSGLHCRVNLIRFHAIPGVELKTSDEKAMTAFRDNLNNHGVVATIRTSRGEDIFAACGMLSTTEKKQQ